MLAAVVGMGCLAAGCGGSSAPDTSTAAPTWSIVALGDSVPHGTNCDCRPYPELTADGLTASSGTTVTAMNDAVAGYTTANVLTRLKSDQQVSDHVRSAHVVEIEVGANDVAYSSSCGTATDCYTRHIPTVEKNLVSIVRAVHDLTAGRKVLVVLLDYWSVWLGGQYAAAHGDAYVAAAKTVTGEVNAAIKATAADTASQYVDLRAAFKGPDYAYDETHYLSSDGDHPNAEGHKKIAMTTEAVIDKALHI
jgi:lysophospholipase L1-like esterase